MLPQITNIVGTIIITLVTNVAETPTDFASYELAPPPPGYELHAMAHTRGVNPQSKIVTETIWCVRTLKFDWRGPKSVEDRELVSKTEKKLRKQTTTEWIEDKGWKPDHVIYAHGVLYDPAQFAPICSTNVITVDWNLLIATNLGGVEIQSATNASAILKDIGVVGTNYGGAEMITNSAYRSFESTNSASSWPDELKGYYEQLLGQWKTREILLNATIDEEEQ